ncbi:MAG: DNA recombination protein RmuC [Bauldia sp.]|nr:DNA recombination protein RmuC [Bauldia sp.]
MDRVVVTLGSQPVTLAAVLVAGVVVLALLVLVAMLAGRRRGRPRAEAEMEARLADFARTQSELSGRMQTIAEVFGTRQADLARAISERMDGLGHRLGQSMTDQARSTHDNLSRLAERLAVIDRAQANITQLSSQVVELQQILANKQSRGAFGQARMEAIIQDGLPSGAFRFQPTLSNGKRPDCLVYFPNGAPALVIDAKFPLEGWSLLKRDANADPRAAEGQFRRDIHAHITAIRQRYFLSGETQDTAFMFVPSESIFADIHERFEDVVQHAHRNRVVIVSPQLLMLSIQVIQSVLRDANIREQAHLVRDEVVRLMEDVGRLDERVRKLQTHFAQANRDIDDILVSTRKIGQRGEKIDALDFGDPPAQQALRLAGE